MIVKSQKYRFLLFGIAFILPIIIAFILTYFEGKTKTTLQIIGLIIIAVTLIIAVKLKQTLNELINYKALFFLTLTCFFLYLMLHR